MKSKLGNLGLILTSLIGYLEWGAGNSMFLFKGEYEVITRLIHDPLSVVHPFTLLPLFGQLLLIITLFQHRPGKTLTITGLCSLALLLVFIFIIGLISLNYKIMLSTLPFLLNSIWVIRFHRKKE